MTYSRSMRGGNCSSGRIGSGRIGSGRNRIYRTRGSFALAKKSYARRLKQSYCRGKKRRTCRATPGCKYASGRKRSFCRKSRSRPRK